MARIRIFHASVNPRGYPYETLEKISQMSFDEAVEFFDNETEICACTTGMAVIDDTKPHEFRMHAEDAAGGDPDTMFNWVKVDCCY